MMRVGANQRLGIQVLACTALVCCTSNRTSVPDSDINIKGDTAGMLRDGLISFNGDPAYFASTGYSAFDGQHDYQVTPNVPSAADVATERNPDPIVPSSLVWTVDSAFLNEEDYTDIDAAVLLTTKKAGTTTVRVSGRTLSGMAIRGEAGLEISQATGEEWKAGDKAYVDGTLIDGHSVYSGDCSLPSSFVSGVAATSACGDCHNNDSGIEKVENPMQTAGYSDDELVQIVSDGKKPDCYRFTSRILAVVPMPDCVYTSFHTWKFDDATKRGIVWKLRSLKPKRPPIPPSPAAIIAMSRLIGSAGGAQSGAAGSGM